MTLLDMSAAGSLLIAVTAAMRSLLLNRLPKQAFVVLWDIIALRLALPFSVPLPSTAAMIDSGSAEKIAFAVKSLSPLASAPAVPVSGRAGFTAAEGVWLIGFLLSASFFAVSYIRGIRIFRQSLPCGDEMVMRRMESLRLRRTIGVRVTDRIKSPLTYGVVHPVILLPRGFETESGETAACVLTHEYVHIRRFDAVRKLFYAAVLCVHWFNPLAWGMFFLAGRDIEISCDKLAVSILGMQKRESYAYSLISMEEHKLRGFPLYNFFGRKTVEERIEAVMKFKKAPALAVALSVVMACIAASAFAAPAGAGGEALEAYAAAPEKAADGAVSEDEYIRAVAAYENISYSDAEAEIQKERSDAGVSPERAVTIKKTVSRKTFGKYILSCAAYFDVKRDDVTNGYASIIAVKAPRAILSGPGLNSAVSGAFDYAAEGVRATVYCNGSADYSVPGAAVSDDLPGVSVGTDLEGNIMYSCDVSTTFVFVV